MPDNPAMVTALLREREGYVTRNLPDRVAEVDKSLAFYGHKAAPETATRPVPPQRTQPETASLEAPETATVPRGRPRRSEDAHDHQH